MSSSERLAITMAGIAWGFAVMGVSPSEAAQMRAYDFLVTIDSGSLEGQTFEGFFNFDSDQVTGVESELLDVAQLNFEFQGVNYTQDDYLFDPPQAELAEGNLLGLFYVTDAFSFEVDFDGTQLFAYSAPQGNGDPGFGDVLFVQREPISVPESGNLVGLFLAGALGWRLTREKRKKQTLS